jgi:NADPH:quinone reductase-like Zn-dependent oxidoreductase
LVERVAEITDDEGVAKAIDCVAGQVGANVSRSLAAGGEVVVYGALSTHRQPDSEHLTIPLPVSELIYGAKRVRGFWLYRWFANTPPWADRCRAFADVRARRRRGHRDPPGAGRSPSSSPPTPVPRRDTSPGRQAPAFARGLACADLRPRERR